MRTISAMSFKVKMNFNLQPIKTYARYASVVSVVNFNEVTPRVIAVLGAK